MSVASDEFGHPSPTAATIPPPAATASADEVALVQAFYERILDALPAQLAVFSPDGRYEYVAPSAIADAEVRRWIVGKSDHEYVALRKLPREVAARRVAAIAAVAEDGMPRAFEESFTNRDGVVRTFHRYVAPVTDANGNVQHVIRYGLDITEQRRVEEQLRQAQKMEAIGRLAGGVAHDFNNLITIISGFADVLHRSFAPDDPRVDGVASIREASERAAELTRQLLSFSRRDPVTVCTIDANQAIRETVHLLERGIGEKVQIALELASAHPWIRADAGQFKQVLLNLVLNARDAMPHGGRLRVSTRRVHFEGASSIPHEAAEGQFIEVAVNDTGVGMSSETLARLFEPFFTTKGPDKGTGLGLSTVYGIVTQLGGYVMAESTMGKGSTFRALLPIATPPGREPSAAPPRHEAHFRTGTVLVAEDEDGVRVLVARVLRDQGHQVLLASSGSEALAVLETHTGPIDLLLTDVVMADFGGRSLADAARVLRPSMSVVYMSGYADDDHLLDSTNPSEAFIEKPFTMERLQDVVRIMVERAHALGS
jgi:two-component system, cell cycle sensor histidine kinase and response regulator CckA